MKKISIIILLLFISSIITSTLVNSPLELSNEMMAERPILTSSGSSFLEPTESSENSEVLIEPSVNQYVALAAGRIRVNVFDYTTSKPLINAAVLIFKVTEKGQTEVASGETNIYGVFEASQLEKGDYNVTVGKTDYQTESKMVTLRTELDRVIVNFYLSKKPLNSGFLEIFGFDSVTKDPLEGAKVVVYDASGKLLVTVYLDKAGFVNITTLTVQSYTLLISKSGYVSQKEVATIDYIGDNDRLKFYLDPIGSGQGFIEVYVMDIAGEMLDGASVKVYNSTMGSIFDGKTKLGFVNVTDLEMGSYNVSVSFPDYESQFKIISIDYPDDGNHGDGKFFLFDDGNHGDGFIYGGVLDENNIAIFNATVKILDENKEVLMTLYTNEKGLFNATELVIGKIYYIIASKEGYVSDRTIVKLDLSGIAKVVLFLREEFGNDGFFDVYVKNETHYLEFANLEIYDAAGNLLNSLLSDSNGFIKITSLKIGSYNMYIVKDGYYTATLIGEITFDGDSDELVVKLRPLPRSLPATGVISIYVRDEDGVFVQDAFVRVLGEMVSYSNYTGEKGNYRAENLYIGKYQITVSKKGYADADTSTVINYVGDVDLVEITLYPEETGSISLYLSLPNDKPDDSIGEAWVRYKLDDGTWSKWLETDDSGYIQLPNTRVGTYTLEILRGGCELQSQTVAVAELGRELNIGSLLELHAADGVTDYYALIVAGQYDRRFTIDAYAMYTTLLNYYGYTSDKIYLLTPRSTHPSTGDPIVYDRLTSRQNVIWALNEISIYADEDDKVLIWWTGHGGIDEMDTYTDIITASDFDYYLDRITCLEMNVLLGPCHSGSFINDLNLESNRAIYTSCRSDEGGWAYYDHSFWPWATYRALHPLMDAITADDNSDGTITLDELYDFAYDFITITKGFTDQHPLFWANFFALPGYTYLGDGTYSSPIPESSIAYLIQSSGDGEIFLDEPEDVEVIASVSVIDNELDDDDFAFQTINSSDIHQGLISEVTINVYYLNGTFYRALTTNSTGMVFFYDVPEGEFAWEAVYEGVEVDSGNLLSDGYAISVYPYPDNWDHQGDYGDIRFNAEESSSHMFVPNVVIKFLSNGGTELETCTTDYIGSAFLFDFNDGSYAWEAFYNGVLVDEGNIAVDSSLFTLETDDIAPIVAILSPVNGDTFILSEDDIILEYSVVELNNYTIDVLIDGDSIDYKGNGSILSEIITDGTYVIRVVAKDIAGNTHYDEVEIFVRPPDTTTSEKTTIDGEISTSTEPLTTEEPEPIQTPGFEFVFVLAIFGLILISKKRN